MGLSIVMGVPPIGWMVFVYGKIPSFEMDDDVWGVALWLRKPPQIYTICKPSVSWLSQFSASPGPNPVRSQLKQDRVMHQPMIPDQWGSDKKKSWKTMAGPGSQTPDLILLKNYDKIYVTHGILC